MECASLATQCSWEDFTTLGLCSDFRNVTNITTHNCKYQDHSDTTPYFCTFDFPGLNIGQNTTMGWGDPGEAFSGQSFLSTTASAYLSAA
ncbi:uncharacterized protein BDZ99DRAFT_212762 [Mytilinidion resinicola]|uniref:Uncharacterized protein n=1 Tax=Mytilinidion resinicola TaxID=574789 RepID=A0A6A6Y046_9PEZI|nr:uncharacterized protein BDZ99DRAFT_212762 [Mytilinidion resinicola]KAF2802019.1 hypothetical protein BDZ99DRAFT_212762 [Mytilinidion resinicola]